MKASFTLSVTRAFPVFLLLALAGFVQPQQASAQGTIQLKSDADLVAGFVQPQQASAQILLGTWQFDVYENATGDLVYSKTVVIDRKAKSFLISNDTELAALKINPSKGTFEGAFLWEDLQNLTVDGVILVGIVETEQRIIGAAEFVQPQRRIPAIPTLPIPPVFETYKFIGVYQASQ